MFKKKTPVVETPAVDTPEQAPESNHAPGTSLAPAATDQLGAFGQIIGDAVARGIATSAPPRKITIGEYVRRGAINEFHPDPKVRLSFDRDYYQNGHQISFDTTYDREVELLNQITHSGRYINRLVEVVVVQNGTEEVVNISFSNKRDKAFELKGHARDFTDILQQIVAAQKEERADQEDDAADRAERKQARLAKQAKKTQPSFGRGKTTRDAYEKVGA
jgi:hypothetical protein